MSKAKPIQVVILSSFSLPSNTASSEDVLSQWDRHHKHYILSLRQYLSQNLDRSNQIFLDLELKDNPNWHINLIGPESTVIIILSSGLLEFYNKPDRRPITDNDRHTSLVVNLIKGLDANHNCTKKYFFVIFEENLLSIIPVIWQGSICHVKSETDHRKVMTIIKDEPQSQQTFSTSFEPLSMIYNDDQAKFINYWKAIYREDKSHTNLSMYYIEQKLTKQVTDDSPDNVSNTGGSDELMTDQLYGDANDLMNKMIVIQGANGCGKSALAQMLCHRWGKGESLKMFRALVFIELNEDNIQKPMIELMRFIPHESAAKKEIILNGLSATQDVLFILDVENYPWRKCKNFKSTEIGQLLLHQRTESLLVLTNQLASNEDDKRIIDEADIIYELQSFDQDQLKHFFWKRTCPMDMKCSEIFQELCKLPLYAVMIPRSEEVVKHTNLTAFCKGIVVQILAKTFPKVCLESLEQFLKENNTFKNICNLAWDLINDQTNTIPITDVRAKNINRQEGGLGFLDFITKPNDKKICTDFLVFRLKTIQHFLAALHFVYTVCTPEIGRDFLLTLMSDHSIHNVWRFVTGLLNDKKKIHSLLKSLGSNHAPPKLLYVQAISESEMKFDEMDTELKEIVSTWINSFNWEKISLYPSDCLAIIKTLNYLGEKEKRRILEEVKELNFSNCNLGNEGMFH
ncbi:hypothetical protein LOD99_8351 [Oopsacas minuta]|uniref:NACHT domain-containing protein n=1 Tax=Oopsacas minuta TaxID=111878 RepID=A0AAV7JHS5_9METZ|nr:hypothetical protein LOD99_8351 [Oopsacas minuta]